jgi:hypothetical protein
MDVQSLLFGRASGWTPGKAKSWAQSQGYKYGTVDVTDQYIRIRQFDPKGLKVKRTIPFGRGIRAVVAREGVNSMATTQEARRRHPSRTSEEARRPRRRIARVATPTTTAEARKRPKRRRVSAATTEASRKRKKKAPASRKKARKATAARRKKRTSHMMEARRPRRRRARASEAWRGDKAGHRKAALKGVRRKKARRRVRASVMAESPKRRRKSKSKSTSPRRRRAREDYMMEAKKSRRSSGGRRRRGMSEAKRSSKDMGARAGQFALAIGSAGLGFVLADGLDRLLATYDPTATEKPKDKFTSDGAGTLANTLNVASTPGFLRLGVGLGAAAVPAIAAMYVEHPFIRSSLEGAAIGAGVSLFKTLWNNFLMPMLVGKDTSTAALQKSYIARLYPAEVASSINLRQTDSAGATRTPQMAVSSAGSGALSAPPADVGPFALSEPGVSESFPTLQNVWGTGGPGADFPTAAQALRQQAGMADGDGGLGALFSDIVSQVKRAMPGLTPDQHAMEAARRMHHELTLRCTPVHHHAVAGIPGWPGVGAGALSDASTGAVSAAPVSTGVAAEPWNPGPPSVPGAGPQGIPTAPGPQPLDTSCGCIGDDNPYLGFVGDEDRDAAPLSLMT